MNSLRRSWNGSTLDPHAWADQILALAPITASPEEAKSDSGLYLVDDLMAVRMALVEYCADPDGYDEQGYAREESWSDFFDHYRIPWK